MRIKKGDFVQVISGFHKGKEGQVVEIDYAKKRVSLEQIKMKKHKKPSGDDAKGKILEVYKPISVSNVMAFDPKKKVLTRIGYKFVNQKKVRFAKKTGQTYDD